MAKFGLSYPVIAELDLDTGAYTKGFKCGKAVSTDITPNYNEAPLYGDDELAEYEKGFKDADVTLGVTELPLVAAEVMFGHVVDMAKKEVVYGTQDVAKYVGFGIYSSEMSGGKVTYVAAWLPKVKFSDSAESYATKGDSIEFKTPSISGKIQADAKGNWRYTQTFENKEEAIKWLLGKAEMGTPGVETPASNKTSGLDSE